MSHTTLMIRSIKLFYKQNFLYVYYSIYTQKTAKKKNEIDPLLKVIN